MSNEILLIFQGHPAEVREQQRWPPRQQSRPTTQISERKLLMPIISEGYASTKFQGGLHGQTEEEKKKIKMKANVIEQATVEEIQTTQ